MESKVTTSQRKTPKAGVDYPRNYAELFAKGKTEPNRQSVGESEKWKR